MIAVGYIRRSKKSEERTVSLDEQARQVRVYCESKDLRLVKIIRHDGVSGAKRSRFDEITTAIREVKATALVFYHLDRLSRDVVGLLDFLRALDIVGVACHEVGSGVIDLKHANKKLEVGVRGVLAEYQRDIISEKTIDALRYKKDNSLQYTRIPPFGFQYANGEMIMDPEEQRALTFLRMCKLKNMGAREARRALLAQNYVGRSSLTTIHEVLRRDVC